MAEVQSAPTTFPEYKSLEKVQGIPVVHDSLDYAHSLLSTNPYTSYVYNTGLDLGSTVYDYSKPIQARLAPLLVHADGLALQGISAVESRFPYPFQTPTEEMIDAVKAQSGQAYNAFDARVRTPAYGIAQSADKSLSPIIDKLELAVNKLSTQPASAESTEDLSQISRAYRLSIIAKDQIVLLSNEQIKQVQSHSVVVQRAMETINKLNESVQAFGKDAQARVHSATTGITSELEKVQASAQALPSKVQTSTKPLQSQLSQTVTDLKTVIQGEGSASQKATKVASAVQNQIGPLLEALKETYTNFIGSPPPNTELTEQTQPTVNGTDAQ